MTSSLPRLDCPSCRVALVMRERQGIEIDYCPQCRGVWLDRGELDKIIERAARETAPQPAPYSGPGRGHGEYEDARAYGHRYPKRKKSFFEELFD